ncbi:MAG: hypothetical protein ACJ8FY_27740 [Gemmataceae bacterium]
MYLSSKRTLAVLVAALVTMVYCQAAGPSPKQAAAGKDLVIHEWGTFSTFSGSNGKNLKFYPYDNDLPEFVHGYRVFRSKEAPQGGLISLETPVVYFYSEKPLTASVQVDFPKGTLTEWYPHAAKAGKKDNKLAWEGIEVLPEKSLRFLSEKRESRYYAARETDAAPLRVTFHGEEGTATEQEKFLFYRGVGNFEMPFTVRALGEDKFRVAWNGADKLGDLYLVQMKAGKLRFQSFSLDQKPKGSLQSDVQLSEKYEAEEQMSKALVQRLIEEGLFEKEARAMVKTWQSAWFGEEGTRVIYILPKDLTGELLPLRIEPKPTSLLRVLVGRHDVVTPEREKHFDALVKTINRASTEQTDEQKAAWQELSKLGRYRDAVQQASEIRLENGR